MHHQRAFAWAKFYKTTKQKVVSVFNSASLNEGMWVSRDTVPRILNLATRWGFVVTTSSRA